jgi:hypothetical protein
MTLGTFFVVSEKNATLISTFSHEENMPTPVKALLLALPLLCPPGVSRSTIQSLPGSGFPARQMLPKLLEKNKRELRSLVNTPPAIAQDAGDVAVIIDDGTILTKTSDNGGAFGGRTFFIDDFAALRAFYRTHGDDYDSVIFFMQEEMDFGQGFAHGGPIKNDIRGIGDLFGQGDKFVDFSPFAGSRGRLQGNAAMNCICFVGDDPFAFFLPDYNIMDVMGQEWGHRRLASPLVIDPDGELSNGMLGRNLAHWNFFSNTGGSPVEGSNLDEVSPNLFESAPTQRPFSDLDLYILGFLSPENVQPFFYVDQIDDDHNVASSPEVGPFFQGRRRDVTIDDVIAALGERVPAPNAGPNPVQERHAFVYIVAQDDVPDPVKIAQVDNFRLAWQSHFSTITRGLAVADTSLIPVDAATLPPVGVFFIRDFAAQGETINSTVQVLHAANTSEIEVLGGGVTVTINAINVEDIDFTLTVDANATPGPRDVAFRDSNGNEHIAPDLFTIAPAGKSPAPYISFSTLGDFNFSNILPVGTTQQLNMGVSFLQANSGLTVSGGDVRVSNVQIDTNAQTLIAQLSTDLDTPTGFRDLIVTNQDGGQDILPNALAIVHPPAVGPFVPDEVDPAGCGCAVASSRTPLLESVVAFFFLSLLLQRRNRTQR